MTCAYSLCKVCGAKYISAVESAAVYRGLIRELDGCWKCKGAPPQLKRAGEVFEADLAHDLEDPEFARIYALKLAKIKEGEVMEDDE